MYLRVYINSIIHTCVNFISLYTPQYLPLCIQHTLIIIPYKNKSGSFILFPYIYIMLLFSFTSNCKRIYIALVATTKINVYTAVTHYSYNMC